MNRRLSAVTTYETVQELINIEQGITELLESIGLDPSKHENESLEALCTKKQWNEDELLKWIKANRNLYKDEGGNDFPQRDLEQWCVFIEKTYYQTTEELIHEVKKKYCRVEDTYGLENKYLNNGDGFIDELLDKLLLYKQFQRDKLFPLIIELEDKKTSILDGSFKSLQKALRLLERDRKIILRSIKNIESKLGEFEQENETCTTYSLFYSALKNLFSAIKNQLQLERESFYPLIKQRIHALNLRGDI
ncbi:MAG TPA: hypothetical protein VLA13_00795 [Massilibacterium sp.]|nr:hypothetical protein [Massilibacterium sp.]